jgi:membrane associated rhomboid family serine protease
MIVLCVIGGPVNRRVGNGWYLATYFGTLLTLGILARWTGLGPVRGASGAIFAVITLFLMLMPAAVVNIVYAAAFPATLVIGLLHAPADWVHWFIRWGHVRVRAWWCVLLIPLMEIVSFFSWRVALGVWPWTHPGHLLGMLCGVVIVLLLPRRISMPQVRV